MRTIFILFALLATMANAHAIECQSKRIHDGAYWQYRLIDGRQCWYSGKRKHAKSELHWAVASRPVLPKPPVVKPPPVVAPVPHAPMAATNFAERWVHLPPAHALAQDVYDDLDASITAGLPFAPVRRVVFDPGILYAPNIPPVARSSMATAGSMLMWLGYLIIVPTIISSIVFIMRGE